MQRNQDMFRGSQVVQFLSLSLFIVIFCMSGMCVCLSLSGCGTACAMPHVWRSKDSFVESLFFSHFYMALGIESGHQQGPSCLSHTPWPVVQFYLSLNCKPRTLGRRRFI